VSALRYANRTADRDGLAGPRYEVKTVWTNGQHSDNDGGSLLPDAIRWLWSPE
jgi:hypothetical protein